MKFTKRICFLILISLTFVSTNVFADDDDMNFEVISQGGQSGVDHQMSMVVDSMMHWKHMWKMHTKPQVEPEPLPKVDFENYVVIAQFLGPVASCGYDIETSDVEFEDDYVKVETTITLPEGPINCLIAEQPFEFILIERTNTVISFELEVDD